MAHNTSVGIIGAGWPGLMHARGYRAAGGFNVVAVADLIPMRRDRLAQEFSPVLAYGDAAELIDDPNVEAVSICLPTHMHEATALAALKAGKHVICETPPGLDIFQTKRLASAAAKRSRVLLYAFQRRFGGAELAAAQAVAKGFAGDIHHVRASWMRTRGVPVGTGWYTDHSKSGGGVLMDLGMQILDLAWHLMGQPNPISVCTSTQQLFKSTATENLPYDVEDFATALIRFEGGKTLELSCAWAINQPPGQNGVICRLLGASGAVDVYTPQGPVLFRHFDAKGNAKATPLKQPKVTGHAAMMRHFRECILGKAQPMPGPDQGVQLMQLTSALYKSAQSGRSVEVKIKCQNTCKTHTGADAS